MTAKKRLIPTVVPKEQVLEDEAETPVTGNEDTEPNLPPISHIKPPEMRHNSTKIRWYLGLGYTVKEVATFLGVRYQQVRNVGTTTPKRAAREDVPPYIIETWEVDETKLGLEMRKMHQFLSVAGAGDMVELAYNDESGQATIHIGRIDLNLRPLDNSTLNPPNVPSLELPCGVTIPTGFPERGCFFEGEIIEISV